MPVLARRRWQAPVALAPLSGAVVAPAEVKVELTARRCSTPKAASCARSWCARPDGPAGDALFTIGDLRSQAELACCRRSGRRAAAAARAEAEAR